MEKTLQLDYFLSNLKVKHLGEIETEPNQEDYGYAIGTTRNPFQNTGASNPYVSLVTHQKDESGNVFYYDAVTAGVSLHYTFTNPTIYTEPFTPKGKYHVRITQLCNITDILDNFRLESSKPARLLFRLGTYGKLFTAEQFTEYIRLGSAQQFEIIVEFDEPPSPSDEFTLHCRVWFFNTKNNPYKVLKESNVLTKSFLFFDGQYFLRTDNLYN